MPKLCFKNNATVKKYDLKDSATTPRVGVNYNGATKYLGLKQGTKSGELSVKVGGQSYYIKSVEQVPATSTTALKISNLHFARSQYDADHGIWDDDVNSLCAAYSVGHSAYASNNWGGYGPFRMYVTTPYSDTVATPNVKEFTITEPLYFLWSDNTSTTIHNHAHGGSIYILDVLKNNVSLVSYKNTSTPIVFEEGDKMTLIVYIGGYNTSEDSGAASFTYGYYPLVRPATMSKPVQLPMGFMLSHPGDNAVHNNCYAPVINYEQTPTGTGGDISSSPQYYIIQHDCYYFPYDNNGYFSSSTSHLLYNNPSLVGTVSHVGLVVNGSNKPINRELFLHAGDRLAAKFTLTQKTSSWGSGNSAIRGQIFGFKPIVRYISPDFKIGRIPGTFTTYEDLEGYTNNVVCDELSNISRFNSYFAFNRDNITGYYKTQTLDNRRIIKIVRDYDDNYYVFTEQQYAYYYTYLYWRCCWKIDSSYAIQAAYVRASNSDEASSYKRTPPSGQYQYTKSGNNVTWSIVS